MAFQAAGASSAPTRHVGGPGLSAARRLSASPYAHSQGPSGRSDRGVRCNRRSRRHHLRRSQSQYWALTKSGGIQTDTSSILYFDQALTAFRFIFRVNGQPAWSSTITRQNGSSNELSWAVALQAR
jgi:hypothetical protein